MLIRNASLLEGLPVDLRLSHGVIEAIESHLPARPGERLIEAGGGAVLPGLHDHHIHLLSLAASFHSYDCGTAHNGAALAAALRQAACGTRWLRAVNYHEGIAGPIDRAWLDRAVPNLPVRVQHRSGRLWILNSAALAELAACGEAPLERAGGTYTGRLYDADDWLRARLGSDMPDLALVGARLASRGVVGVTDTTPGNGRAFFAIIAAAQARGDLPQRVAAMGGIGIIGAPASADLFPLAIKLHLHEGDYPAPETFIALAQQARRAGLAMAVHAVTEADLVFAVSLLQEAGVARGARIEHASVVPAGLIAWLAQAGVTVVTQPHFIAERGAAYQRDIPGAAQHDLYRCASLQAAGIPVGAGSDAPFGGWDPWAAMAAAVCRRTQGGHVMGAGEAITPQAALALFTTSPWAPGGAPRRVAAGEPADLCVLTTPWSVARQNLAAVQVQATLRDGVPIHAADEQEQNGRKVA